MSTPDRDRLIGLRNTSGLLDTGARVEVSIYSGDKGPFRHVGTVAYCEAEPAPYLMLVETGTGDGRLLVFLGPGVTLRPADPPHPALG